MPRIPALPSEPRRVKESCTLQLLLILALFLPFVAGRLSAEAPTAEPLPQDLVREIDAAVSEVLEETGAPSASIAVVRDGAIALTRAYGRARLEPERRATPQMRYAIGSISKQFIAAAVVMLAQEGKLDLDEPIARFFAQVTRAEEITLRQLLSHTSGIRDYWPQDYVPPAMLEPITAEELIGRYAHQSLDFEPGTQWQYSNTGYVIAGAIVEKVVGKALMEFLGERIFAPLGMQSVFDVDRGPLPPEDAAGYQRFALGPLRDAPKEAPGWLFAAGQLAMTAEDLAKWSVALLAGVVPGSDVFREIAREVMLETGVGVGYGLGLDVDLIGGRRRLGHGGEVSGFTATSRLYPEDRFAVVALVNQDAVGASGAIGRKIADLVQVADTAGDREMLVRVGEVLAGLRKGRIERSWFTANGNAYFSETALTDIRASLKGLGSPKSITQEARSLRGGLITRVYHARFKKKLLEIYTRAAADGKLEQYTLGVE